VDMEGDLPEELTANLKATIEIEGRPPVVVHDTFSGNSFSGGRAPQALYNPLGTLIGMIAYNGFEPLRIKSIDCTTTIEAGRRTADIEGVEVESDTYAPGETVKAVVLLRPYRGQRQRVVLALALPKDLPEGPYTATIGDDLANARAELRDNPALVNPQNLDQLFESLKLQTSAKRTNLAMRLPYGGTGVALDGKTLSNLPPSMVQIMGSGRRTGAQTVTGALVARQSTEWVIQGSDTVRFNVTRNKRVVSGQ